MRSEETAALKEEAEALRQRTQRLLAHRDLLAAQSSERVHKRRVLARAADASRRARLAAVEDQLAKSNAEVCAGWPTETRLLVAAWRWYSPARFEAGT